MPFIATAVADVSLGRIMVRDIRRLLSSGFEDGSLTMDLLAGLLQSM